MRAVREPMFWLVIALPLITIVVGILTIRRLAQDGPLDAVPEPVQRRAQVQTTDLAPDQRALALQLRANLARRDDGQWVWQEWPQSEGTTPVLSVLHPNRASGDVRLTGLDPDEAISFPSDLPLALCEFRLEDAAQGWRLVGRLNATGQVLFHSKLQVP